ncbi:MAG: PKD domain-containing protein [Gammaproteobacteria bacterium]
MKQDVVGQVVGGFLGGLKTLTCVIGLAGLVPAPAAAVVENITPFDWSMPDRLLENTGIAGYDPADPIPRYDPTVQMVPPGGWTVNFDACTVSASAITSFRWLVDGIEVGVETGCEFSHAFPREGSYQVTLIVTDDLGDSAELVQEVVVQDWLIIAMGDSYASGEGNPEIPADAQVQVDFSILLDLVANLQADVQAALDQLPGLEDAQAIGAQLRDDALATRNQAAADLAAVQADLQALIVIRNDVEDRPAVVTAKANLVIAQNAYSSALADRNAAQTAYDSCSGPLDCSTKWLQLQTAQGILATASANLSLAQAALVVARDAAVVLLSIFDSIQSFSALQLAIDSKTLLLNAAQNTYNAANAAYQSALADFQDAEDAVLSLQSVIADLQQAWEDAKSNARNQYLDNLPLWTSVGPSWGTAEYSYAEIIRDGENPGEALRCHRSMFSGQARAALAIEQADPHTSVTLLHLSCTGATIAEGLVGPYGAVENLNPLLNQAVGLVPGITPDSIPDQPRIDGQVCTAADKTLYRDDQDVLRGREVDAMVISIGGNDVGFARIIEKCALGEPCHQDLGLPPDEAFNDDVKAAIEQNCRPATLINALTGASLPLSENFPFSDKCLAAYDFTEENLNDGCAKNFFDGAMDKDCKLIPEGQRKSKIDFLKEEFLRLNTELKKYFPSLIDHTGNTVLRNPERIYLTQYPDPTGDDSGNYCGWLPTQVSDPDQRLTNIPGVTNPEIAWADAEIATSLRDTTQVSADRFAWQFITRTGVADETISSTTRNHGYCADDHWTIRIPETFITQMGPSGAAHPNRAGHAVYRQAIYNQLVEDFYPAGPDTPRLPREDEAVEPKLMEDESLCNQPTAVTVNPVSSDGDSGSSNGGAFSPMTFILLAILQLFTVVRRKRSTN